MILPLGKALPQDQLLFNFISKRIKTLLWISMFKKS